MEGGGETLLTSPIFWNYVFSNNEGREGSITISPYHGLFFCIAIRGGGNNPPSLSVQILLCLIRRTILSRTRFSYFNNSLTSDGCYLTLYLIFFVFFWGGRWC